MIKPSYERIKFLQNQLRTAIQNHHVLLLKSRIAPQDTELKNQMNILQSLIISMGRTQNDLLEQLERELDGNVVTKADVRRHLAWLVPMNVPLFKKVILKDIPGKRGREDGSTPAAATTPTSATTTGAPKQPPRCYSRMHSLLKPKDSPKDAEGLGKPEEMPSVWKNPKKLQSVLKPKPSNESVRGFIKLQGDTKICGDNTILEGGAEDTGISPKRRKTTDSESGSRSNSVSPKPVTNARNHDHPRNKVVESKLLTRSKRRLAVQAAAAAARAATFSGNSEMDLNELEESLKNEPIDTSVPTDDTILNNLEVYQEMGKKKFLEHFSLISLSEREAIRLKKCGRKRRTVAGQSNFYNDYFQHSALSMKNPKWRYEMQPVRRASRESGSKKSSILEGARQVRSPPSTSGEVTPEEKSSPPREAVSPTSTGITRISIATSPPPGETLVVIGKPGQRSGKVPGEEETEVAVSSESGQNSVVVEATEIEDEEEKDKDKLCILCHTQGEEGTLEICTVCGEKYHLACASPESNGRCTLCLAQISGFKTIVGGESGVSSASSLELIKRYLPS